MRPFRFLPFAFVAGAHGFALFLAYVALVLAAAWGVRCMMARADKDFVSPAQGLG